MEITSLDKRLVRAVVELMPSRRVALGLIHWVGARMERHQERGGGIRIELAWYCLPEREDTLEMVEIREPRSIDERLTTRVLNIYDKKNTLAKI